MKNEKELKAPPLGLMPKYLHDEKRFNDVCNAIGRYWIAGLPINIEWVQEYNELVAATHKKKGTKTITDEIEALNALNFDL